MPLPQKVDMPAVWTKPAERYETRPRRPYTSNLRVASQKLTTRRSTKVTSRGSEPNLRRDTNTRSEHDPVDIIYRLLQKKLTTRRSTRIALQNEGGSAVHGTIAGLTCLRDYLYWRSPGCNLSRSAKTIAALLETLCKIFLGPWVA
jgi:hypothetical protein